MVADDDSAKGNNEAISAAFEGLSKELKTEPKKLANDMLTLCHHQSGKRCFGFDQRQQSSTRPW